MAIKTGTNGADRLSGGDGGDILRGLGGNDILEGWGGNDILDGGAGDARLSGGAGNDILRGGACRDLADYYSESATRVDLRTGVAVNAEGRDILQGIEDVSGSLYADVIIGDGGDNRITGSHGADTLTGGGGRDVFRYDDRFAFGDTITDFTSGTDTLELSLNEIWPANSPATAGRLSADHFVVASAPQDGDDWFFLDPESNILYWDGDGTGTMFPALEVARFTGGTPVAADILFV